MTQAAAKILQHGCFAETQSKPVARLVDIAAVQAPEFTRAWDALSKNASEPNPFHESWYLGPALALLPNAAQTQIFTLWDGDTADASLLGLMPICQLRQYGGWPLTHYQNWLHPNAFLGTPLVQAGCEEMFWDSLLQLLDGKGGQSIFLHISGLPIGGPLQQALGRVCAGQGRNMALVHQKERALLEGEMAADAYYQASVRSKKRKELRRQKNRLGEMGELIFSHDSGGDFDQAVLQSWIDEFLTLERRGWKGAGGSALDCADHTRDLFKRVLQGAAERDRLELLDLRLDGKALAMLVNFHCPPGSFSFKTSFDEEFARFSPGVLLQIENLALLEREAIDWCDSCAAEGHPMIDSLWSGRRAIGRYSVAIGGGARRALFGLLLHAETAKMTRKKTIGANSDGSGKSL